LDQDAREKEANQSVKKELVVETGKKDNSIEMGEQTPHINKNVELAQTTTVRREDSASKEKESGSAAGLVEKDKEEE